MSLVATHPRPLPRQPNFVDQLFRDEPLFAGSGLIMALIMLPTIGAIWADDTTFNGISVWIKPLKFEFSLSAYLFTLAFFARYLPAGTTEKFWYRGFSIVVVTMIVIEMLWIGGAAANGIASHFNKTSPLMIAMYPLMGLAAIILTSASTVYAWLIYRNHDTGLSLAVKSGIVAGLALTLPLTLLTAGTMAGMGSHAVGGSGSDAGGLALLGWLRDGGDMRVGHFFATHAMHFIPAIGLLSARLVGKDNIRPVVAISAIFTVFVLGVFVQALAGRPFI